jgi:hypothetical protein
MVWTNADTERFYQHIRQGKVDPTDTDHKTIKTFFNNNVWVRQRGQTLKTFYRNYRRKCAEWISNTAQHGVRGMSLYIPSIVPSSA